MDNDQNRIVYIDNLRNVLVYLVVVLHAACGFGYPIMYYWAVIDKEGSHRVYETVLMTLDVFLMPHLIFLATFFIFISLENKTKIQYLKTRFMRLYVPVIVFVFCAGDVYFQILSKRVESFSPSYLETFMAYWGDLINNFRIMIQGSGKKSGEAYFTQMHLWFMSFLFFTTLILLTLPSPRKKKNPIEIPKKNGVLIWTMLFSLSMSFSYFAVIVFYTWKGIEPFSWISFFKLTEVKADQFWMLLFFILFGLYVHKKEWLTRGDTGNWKLWGFFSAVLGSYYILVTYFQALPVIENFAKIVEHNWHFADQKAMPELQPAYIRAAIARIVLYPMLSMSLLMFLLSFFRRFFNNPNRLTAFCSKHSINVYILHFIPIVLIQYAFKNVALPAPVKIVLFTVIAITACLWLSHRLIYPYPKTAIAFFVLLKLVSLSIGFEFYYRVLLGIIFVSFVGANFDFFRFKFQKRQSFAGFP